MKKKKKKKMEKKKKKKTVIEPYSCVLNSYGTRVPVESKLSSLLVGLDCVIRNRSILQR